MKILWVLNYRNQMHASIEDFILEIIRQGKERGCQWVLAMPFPIQEWFRREIEALEVETEEIQDLYYKSDYWKPEPYRRIYKIIRKHKPDRTHFHFFSYFSLYPWVAALAGSGQLYFTDHFSRRYMVSRSRGLIRIFIARFFTWPVRRFIAVSEFVRLRNIQKLGIPGRKVETIMNGIRIDRFIGEEGIAPGRAKRILAVARLVHEKGFHVLLEAFRILLTRHPEATLTVVGDGPERSRLEGWAREHLPINACSFPGSSDHVERFMRNADVFVHPCQWDEAFGLVLVEAMASGLPVVASRIGAIPEIIQDGVNGWLVPPGDPAALAKALENIFENRQEASEMGQRGRRQSWSYDVRVTAQKTLDLYFRPKDGEKP